ncbi:MAG TPA: arginine deiminase family protein [Pyrinomonadaceae bacterium]|nr:arginine deiminase family protein [Pyrinomonadaceae bacterium]
MALTQHAAYCEALVSCGLSVTALPPDADYPDSTFVEDTAIITERGAIITRPGADTRRGEISSIENELSKSFGRIAGIQAPGTVDGGDVCEAGRHFFIGISDRTNEAGASQLSRFLWERDYSSALIDIRGVKDILHLKSGISYLGQNKLVVIEALANRDVLRGYEMIRIHPCEEYAANCVAINGSIIIADGFPLLKKQLIDRAFRVVSLKMSEFRKMDGGLSCLSLRF